MRTLHHLHPIPKQPYIYIKGAKWCATPLFTASNEFYDGDCSSCFSFSLQVVQANWDLRFVMRLSVYCGIPFLSLSSLWLLKVPMMHDPPVKRVAIWTSLGERGVPFPFFVNMRCLVSCFSLGTYRFD